MSSEPLAAALANAFLEGDWTHPGMIESGANVLGARRRWLGPLARTVLAVYHRPPVDRPRELTSFILDSEAFRDAIGKANRTGKPLRPQRHPVPTSRMVRARWPVPTLNDVGELAGYLNLDLPRLEWLADTRHYQRRTPLGALHPYRYHWMSRPGRVPRLIEAPTATMRRVQRRLLDDVLALIPVHPAAHGFVPGRDVRTATAPHAGAGVLIRTDLRAFFASITAGRVYGLLRRAGYPEPVAHTMTGLLTLRTPVAVIAAMPPGGTPTDRHALRQLLRNSHLPQGAPTSPALSNVIAYRFDVRCERYAAAAGFSYTRYADDLLLSGPRQSPRRPDAILRAINRIAAAEGFAINPAKTSVRYPWQRQAALGVVVNERPRVSRDDYDRLRAILHNAARTSGSAQNRDGHPDFRAHLAGRIAWVAAMDPDRGAALQRVFEQVDWAD